MLNELLNKKDEIEEIISRMEKYKEDCEDKGIDEEIKNQSLELAKTKKAIADLV